MIRNIVFDIGNVLIGFDAKAYLRSLFGEEKARRVGEHGLSALLPDGNITRNIGRRVQTAGGPDDHVDTA